MQRSSVKTKEAQSFLSKEKIEALIERACWKDGTENCQRLLLNFRCNKEPNSNHGLMDEFWFGSQADLQRFKELCLALKVQADSITLDDLVARKVIVVCELVQSEDGKVMEITGYKPMHSKKFHTFFNNNER